ncbi:MAG: D-alanine--D-alanine ligase [Candidatus Kapaibacteriota bacterium]
MNIAVFLGGLSTEREISIRSGVAIFKALKELNHDVILIDPAFGSEGIFSSPEMMDKLPPFSEIELDKHPQKKYLEVMNHNVLNSIDFVFIALHGKFGEDGTIQTLLELRGIPYSGSGPKASAIGMDKNLSKIIFSATGVSTPRWTIVKSTEIENFELCEELRKEFGKKMVVKPNDQGSTVGTSIILDGNLDDIKAGLVHAGKYSKLILVENYIEGREITVGIIGQQALPIVEIIPESGFYDFEHKYNPGKTEYVCPAELPEEVSEFIQDIALVAYRAIGCKGFARVDFRLNEDLEPFALEINTIPGFTETSLVPKAAKAIGIDFPELCQRIITESLQGNAN